MSGLTKTSWKKGQSGNPNGRPKKPEIDALRTAIKVVEKENDMTLLEYFVRRAYENDSVLVALCKKFLPDMKSIVWNFPASLLFQKIRKKTKKV
jgi:hypothetical protein